MAPNAAVPSKVFGIRSSGRACSEAAVGNLPLSASNRLCGTEGQECSVLGRSDAKAELMLTRITQALGAPTVIGSNIGGSMHSGHAFGAST